MKSIETSGKTVEDAIQAGLTELKCDLADVNIDVLESGSPGLFGMFGKLARVRLTLQDNDSDFDLGMPVMSLDQQEEAPRRAKAEKKPQQQKSEKAHKPESKPQKPEKAPKPVEDDGIVIGTLKALEPKAPQHKPQREERERRPRDGAPARPPRDREKVHDTSPIEVSTEDLPPLELDALTETGKRAYDFLSNVTRMMGVDVEIRLRESEGQLVGQMIGDSLGVLIGRRGDTLDALQYLTSLQVNKGKDDYVRVTLDTEHYRAKRVDALTKLAGRMASRVRKTGHRVALEPMNPYERRILHSALQGNSYVTTFSEGEEPYRRVIITLK